MCTFAWNDALLSTHLLTVYRRSIKPGCQKISICRNLSYDMKLTSDYLMFKIQKVSKAFYHSSLYHIYSMFN